MSAKTKLLTTVAALSLIGSAAVAQDNSTATQQPATELAQSQFAPGWNENLDTTYGPIADTQVAELVGMNVVTEGGDDVGEVDNFVIIDQRIQAVVGVGGFLGLGEHDVALPLDELSFDGEKLVIAYTREELEAMPEYDEAAEQTAFAEGDTFRTRAMPADSTVATGDAGADQDTKAMDVADGTIEDASEADAPSGEEVAAAEDAAGGADTVTEEIAEAKKGPIEQEAEEIAAEVDQAVTEGAEAVADAASDAGEAIKEGAENMAAATDQAVEKATDEVAEAADPAMKPSGTWDEQLNAEFADIADMPVGELIDYPVATTDGEKIGEIEAIARHNEKVVALVGIGGFLGLGEHDVALELGELSFDGEKFIAVGYTEDDLKAMPEYDASTVEKIDVSVPLRSAL